jgi:hypothetical protein
MRRGGLADALLLGEGPGEGDLVLASAGEAERTLASVGLSLLGDLTPLVEHVPRCLAAKLISSCAT